MRMQKNFVTALLFLALLSYASAATYYSDPVDGNTTTGDGSNENSWGTLESVASAGKFNGVIIKSGDTIKLKSGFHGQVYFGDVRQLNKDINHITIEAYNNSTIADVSRVYLKNANYWTIKGLRVSPSFGPNSMVDPNSTTEHCCIVSLSGSHYVTIEDNDIFTVENDVASSWTAQQWSYTAWQGVMLKSQTGTSDTIFRNNYIRNVAIAIRQTGSNCLCEQNVIDGYSCDAISGVASGTTIQDNVIQNYHLGTACGSHTDMIQQGEGNLNNLIIRRNLFLPGASHGIFMQGSPMSNILIENNVIMSRHARYGIALGSDTPSLYRNIKILNNTVVSPSITSTNPAIYIGPENWDIAQDVLIRNNIAGKFPAADSNRNIVVEHNFDIDNYDRNAEFVDYAHGDMRLAAGSSFIDAGSSLDTPTEDLDRNPRPQGAGYDAGAYEFSDSTPACTNGQTRQCGTTDTGECSYGTQTCSNGTWGSCIGTANPTTEICDNKDNDCDGQTDEENICCPGYALESIANNNCLDAKDNDCDTKTDTADEGCQTAECTQDSDCPTGQTCQNSACAAECIDNNKLLDYISQWKQGNITMLALMQKMKQWKAGTGCP